MRILVADSDLGDMDTTVALLHDRIDAEVRVTQCVTEADVMEEVDAFDPDGMLVQWAPITRAVLDRARSCRVVSRLGVGLDMIDVEAADALGITVMNVAHYCTEEVATHATALALSLWRRLPQMDAHLRSGEWDPARWSTDVRRLSDSTVGVIGFGRIGRQVARAFDVWGSRILVCDPWWTGPEYPSVDLDEILDEAQLISVHAPLTAETYHMIDEGAIRRARQRPVIVNTSRGGLVDVACIPDALKGGRLSGFGVDVYETEPFEVTDEFRSAPNVLMTPHSSWCSVDALPALRRGGVQNLIDFFGNAKGRGWEAL